ncbi:unnamed protein product [Phytomonas sp. Hart1]|nr:unnamed protein product [Phytomonas sp. Hart1]|eukprot:CCW69350.1 unnamed protein product [Phytomonas sp. isolate Hart1]
MSVYGWDCTSLHFNSIPISQIQFVDGSLLSFLSKDRFTARKPINAKQHTYMIKLSTRSIRGSGRKPSSRYLFIWSVLSRRSVNLLGR